MKQYKNNMSKRILAMAMALLVVFGAIPVPTVMLAAEAGKNVAVNITVTDSESNPIQGATVKYALEEEQPNAEYADWTTIGETTNEEGKLTVLGENAVDVTEGVMLWLEISIEGYTSFVKSIDIYTESQQPEACEVEVALSEEIDAPEVTHEVSVSVIGGNATVTIAGNDVTLAEGVGAATVAASDSVAYTITPEANLYIKDVKIDGNSIDASKIPEKGQALTMGTFDVSVGDVSLTVELGEYYTVSTTQTTIGGDENAVGGTITLNGDAVEYIAVDGTEKVVLYVGAAEGYMISGIEINGVLVQLENGETFDEELEADSDVVVTFTKEYTVTITFDSENGEVVTDPVSNGTVEGGITTAVVMGTTVKVIATPITGFRVEEVKINGVAKDDVSKANGSGYETTINADQDYTVEITFAHNQHVITVADTENGTVIVENNGAVKSGDDPSVTIIPNDGYTIASIIVKNADDSETLVDLLDDVEVGYDDASHADGTYSFEILDITEDKTVVVAFKQAIATDNDFSFECENIWREINDKFFVAQEEGRIVFETEKEGIRVFVNGANGVELVGGDDTTQAVTVDANDGLTEVVRVQVYFQPENELPAWYDIPSVKADAPIKMIMDNTPADIVYTIGGTASLYGYYKDDITITVTATDDEYYSGIDKITYFITDEAIADGTSYDDALIGADVPLYNYAEDANGQIEQEISGKSFVVDANTYNSQFTKVWIKVIDRAGNVSVLEAPISLPINTVPPMVELSIDGGKNQNIADAYYVTDRVLTFTVTDRNDTFLPETFGFSYTKDDQSVEVTGNEISWNTTGDVHVGTYTFSGDGKYTFEESSVTYTNKADSSNEGVTVDSTCEDLNVFVIDNTAPGVNDITITYPNDVKDPFNDRYYNDYVNVTIISKDNVSGVKEIRWKYVKSDGVSDVNKDSDEDFTSILCESDATECTKTITLPKVHDAENNSYKQLNGYLVVQIIDWAGNVCELKDDGQVFVVDNRLPIGDVTYTESVDTIGLQKYYDGDIDFVFNIKEANFISGDVKIFVSKDGAERVQVPGSQIQWTDLGEDKYQGTYTISGDGDYVLYMEYTDKSGNVMTPYQTNILTIDTQDPVVKVTFDEVNQKIVYTITEHNFRPQDITISGSIVVKEKDTSGNLKVYTTTDLQNALRALPISDWTKTGDVYTYASDDYVDGHYQLIFNYEDISKNDAETFTTENFYIDNSAPVNVTITYSESLLEKVLEAITLGFYKANVTVTFTAYDDVAGIDYFTWNYTKENGASTINRNTDTTDSKVAAVQDAKDKTKYTATVTLPNTDVAQLRGYLAVVATDKRTNASEKVTDAGRVIVVDSIAPTMKVEYSLADKVVGSTSYYNNDVEVTFTVTEANFFKDEVKVMVSKDGGTAYAVTPQWTNESVDTHIGKYVLSGDGDYVISVNYTDYSTNKMAEYTSNVITIDTVKPVINVKYANTNPSSTLVDVDGMQRKYFANKQTATITITEHNFNANDVVLDITTTDVAGKAVTGTDLYTVSEWKDGSEADTHVLEITYAGDANYSFDIAYTDQATNEAVDYATDYFTVDKSAPAGLRVSYSTSILETVLETITFGFYNAKVDVTIVAEDAISGINSFAYSYIKAEGVSEVNTEALNQAIAAANITYSNDGKTATAKFQIPKDVLTNTTQFNGTIAFDAVNRSGLKSNLEDDKYIVVDNIAPKAEVTYNEPVVNENGISYYDRDVVVTVVITEANFYASDVVVMVSKDGGAAYAVTPSWNSSNVNLHTGTFTLTADGDYVITINYRDKSSNEMTEYTSGQLTIDTDIQEPTITFNGNNETGHAYKNEVVPEISFSDINYDTYDVFLYRTYMNAIGVDITEEKGIKELVTVNEERGSASLNIFAADENGKYDQNDDGIYRLVVKMTDKAGHTTEKEAVFTVNRYGSVYAFDKYLVELIANGGAYIKTVTEDLIITEYNADQLVSDSLNIEITRDGKPLEDAKYTVSPTINENVAVGESGWYQYEYVISKENFVADGIYKISISSKDATGNVPENSNYEDKNIVFRVDNSAPEITSIVGLEKDSYDATEQKVSYVVFDAIGLKSIKIYLDGEILEEITDFTADLNNYSGDFIIPEKDSERTVRLVVEDLAGNIIDTDSEAFTSAYAFNSKVTVTTDDMARFMSQLHSNTPLLIGSVVGTAGVAALAGVGIHFRMKRRVK